MLTSPDPPLEAQKAAVSESSWRSYVENWLVAHAAGGPEPGASDEAVAAFDKKLMGELHLAGLAAPQWPLSAGGLDVPPSHEIALHQEFLRTKARWPGTFYCALNHAGRSIIVHGTEEQQRRHLGAILRGESIWCQAFSEPNAGSDLASLQTTAQRDGDQYVINGQKVWSSKAHIADHAILLARTSTSQPRHYGISCFLLDMRTPGVEVRPIRKMTGESGFCEIFLNDVVVPVTDRLGEENRGWAVALTVLSAERGPGFLGYVVTLSQIIEALLSRSAQSDLWPAGRPLDDSTQRDQLAAVLTEADVLTSVLERVLLELATTGTLSPASSVIKLMFSELHRKITELAVEFEGLRGQLGHYVLGAETLERSAPGWLHQHLESWMYLIGAGTSEMQRNHISERVLGLPREPSRTST